jgi:WD40 repeat protein
MKTIIPLIYPAVKTVTRKLAAFAALTLTCATGFGAPPPPNTGGGTIYFIGPWDSAQQGGTAVMRTMNSDGSNNRQLGFGLFGNPSTALHGGRRWFLYHKPIADSYYPDGTQVFELFAYRDDYDSTLNNNSTTKVQLTNDIDLQAKPWCSAWVPGDQEISFKARRWSGGGVVAGGIYTASPVFDANGNITGLVAQPTTPAIPFPLVETAPGDLWPAFEDYSWGPGERVVYTEVGTHDLLIADLLGSPHQRIFGGYALWPQWSPDGTKIAFTTFNLGIATIKPNGSHFSVIVSPTSNWSAYRPYWSPTSSNIAFTGQATQSGSPPNLDVNRVTATGNNLTDLTNQPAPFNEYINHTFGGGGWR